MGLALAGLGRLFLLPVSPLPNIDIPTIVVTASMAGRQPRSDGRPRVATPLERHLGAIADGHRDDLAQHRGLTQVVLQFDISRDIDGAARDVQAAINAARAGSARGAAVQSHLPQVQSGRPADHDPGADLQDPDARPDLRPGLQHLCSRNCRRSPAWAMSQLNGASLPAVRIELNPRALFKYGIGLEDVRAAHRPPPTPTAPRAPSSRAASGFQVYANDTAIAGQSDYKTPDRRLSQQRARCGFRTSPRSMTGSRMSATWASPTASRPSWCTITKQPGANVIQVVDNIAQDDAAAAGTRCRRRSIWHVIKTPPSRSATSVRDVEMTLVISTILVILVVFLFLRNCARHPGAQACRCRCRCWALSACMYLLGFSLDNFSLMALIISTGFVVDNTIVVLENVTRHLETGREPGLRRRSRARRK